MRFWTTNEEKQLIEMRHKGISQKEIAETLGRSETAIRDKIDEIRREWGLTKVNHIWNTHDREKLWSLHESGARAQEMADIFRVSTSAIYQQICIMKKTRLAGE